MRPEVPSFPWSWTPLTQLLGVGTTAQTELLSLFFSLFDDGSFSLSLFVPSCNEQRRTDGKDCSFNAGAPAAQAF
jgi:hypothetical protein